MSMNPEVKSQWLAALRSGEFVQAKEFLSTEKGQCCLGVLCVLAEKVGVVQASSATATNGNSTRVPVVRFSDGDFDQSDSELPAAVSRWAGLKNSNPTILHAKDIHTYFGVTLAELNDDYNYSFAEIADIIENEL